MPPTELLDRAKAFALAVAKFYWKLPKTPDAQVPGVQFLKCSSSVSANYHAAQRGRSRAEFIANLGTVVEEIDESVVWLLTSYLLPDPRNHPVQLSQHHIPSVIPANVLAP